MLKNYLKILFRSFSRNKTFTLINILGLSAGLTCFLLIGLYIVDEFAFDSHHEKLDRTYLVVTDATFEGQSVLWTGTPNITAPTISKEIPEVEKAVRLFPHDFGKLAFMSTPEMTSTEKMFGWADPGLFDVLTYTFVKGDPAAALVRPNTAVMSESAARKYFGTTDVLGKTIKVDNRYDLEVTGVFQDPPRTSRFQYPIIGSFSSHFFGQDANQSWGNASFETYLLTHPGISESQLSQKLNDMISKAIPKENQWFKFVLRPLKDTYLYMGNIRDISNPEGKKGDIAQVKILVGLGLIVIIIAAVNYMNLATAQSQRRFKEIGVSKTLGATSQQLARRFYSETAVFVLLALTLSMLTVSLTLPLFNIITGKVITLSFLSTGWFWACFFATWILLSLVAGVYPALYLSSFSPKRVLKIASPGVGGNVTLRKGLVVVQFSTSIILIISTIILYQQLNFMRDKKLGYQPEQVVAILTTGAQSRDQVVALKTEIEQIPEVIAANRAQAFPGGNTSGRTIKPLSGEGEGKSIQTTRSTSGVMNILGIPLIAGRDFPENKSPDDTTCQVILNKTTIDFLGVTPEEAIGRKVFIGGLNRNGMVEIIGVSEDFHFASVKEPIGAYCYHNGRSEGFNYMLVKLQASNLATTMQQLEATYKKVIPAAFEYTFLEQRLENLYKTEEQLAEVIFLFSSLAIVIACLGLYALAAYTTEQRIKEIGIRKALGASVFQLTNMLSQDFIRLVLISFVVAAPAGYFLMSNWLESFAYRVDVNLIVFAGAGLVSLLIAWFTVGFESMKAARSNPVDSLRNE